MKDIRDIKILIKGAGDLASGIACRLKRSGFRILMTETPVPTTVRRTVAFSPAVYEKKTKVENLTGVLCENIMQVNETIQNGDIAVVVDEDCAIRKDYQPDIIIDAIIAKKNINTSIEDADIVIGVGPGFVAGKDCHCVIETKRGHYLGRCIWEGSAIPNTGVPGVIGGYSTERIIRACADGIFKGNVKIGAVVKKNDIVGFVDEKPIYALIDGVVRGLLQDGVPVTKGMKSGDIDPRCDVEHCYTVSDKASSIGGGALEAIMHMLFLKNQLEEIKK